MKKQTRREFFKTMGSATVSAAVLSNIGMTGCAEKKSKRPNVILIMTDDQGYGDLGCHGNDKIKTPNIDRFYEESVRFTNFYVCPLCSPTRASLLTGRYNYRTGVVDTWVGLALMRPEEVTIAELHGDAGYKTGIFGKWHLGDNYPLRAMDQGFKESLVHRGGGIGGRAEPPDNMYHDPVLQRNGQPEKYKGYCTDIFFNEALEFIEKNSKESFFVYLPTNVPHVPLQISDEYVAPYRLMGLDESSAKHYGMIANVDENMGRLMQRLKELEIDEDTIVIFMSDNGPLSGRYNAGLRDTKGSVYEGAIRVPFFIRWGKKLKGGRDIDRIAAHIDVLPTLLELCGVTEPRGVPLDGVSLVPLILGSGIDDWPDRTLFFQQSRPDPDGIDEPRLFTHCAARSQRYKIVMTAKNRRERNTKAIGFEETELYELSKDLGEQNDISKEHPDIVQKMRKAYEEWFKDVTKGIEPVVRIHLGSSKENPLMLNNQDLCGNQSAIAYRSWSKLNREFEAEPEGYGYWNVTVTRSGRYEITLRFGPVGKGRMPVLNPGKAYFKLGDVNLSHPIQKGAKFVKFTVNLKAGEGRLEAYFTGQRKDGKKVTPFFVDVNYLDV